MNNLKTIILNRTILFSFVLIGLLLFVVLGIRRFIPKKTSTPEEKIHYHAGFIVFEKNKQIDFSDIKFMYLKPCLPSGRENSDHDNTQLEKAHLHDSVGDLVHIEAKGAFWRDLFTNIKFPIDYSSATGYINNKKIQDFQNQPIRPYDSLIVFMGENNEALLNDAVTREYIETQSKKASNAETEISLIFIILNSDDKMNQ